MTDKLARYESIMRRIVAYRHRNPTKRTPAALLRELKEANREWLGRRHGKA